MNFAEKHVIGMDLGGTKLAAALFTFDGAFVRALKPLRFSEIFPAGAKPPPATVAAAVRDAAAGMARELTPARGTVDAIGIASAGFVEGRNIVEATNVGLKNCRLPDLIRQAAGIDTFLFKDSWAPAFALAPAEPSIVFSVGTGLGGVSCEPGGEIRLLSRTLRTKPIWIPLLMKNDDPGFAVAFSVAEMKAMIETAAAKTGEGVLEKSRAGEIAASIRAAAEKQHKLTPPGATLAIAKLLAPTAVAGWRQGEVFADFHGAAPFPALVFELITGERIDPPELDRRIAAADPAALAAATVQAEFLAAVILEMQIERTSRGLPPAARAHGAGSGYNAAVHGFLSTAIAEAYNARAAAAGLPPLPPVELLSPPHPETTLAAHGAALGAIRAAGPA